LDPRKTAVYDSCINCGECIDACNRLHVKQGTLGLLRFELGERKSEITRKFRSAAISLASRTGWMAPLWILGAGMFIWGLWSYEPYHVAVYRAENQQGLTTIQNYRIAATNKLYRSAEMKVKVQGLPEGSYHLSAEDIKLAPAGHESLTLSIEQTLPRGLYSVVVNVDAVDGWSGKFRIQHFSEKG
jgi:polyferredoxin